MRTLRLYRHGVTMATVRETSPVPPPRTEVRGWSLSATRRNVAFLRSVDERRLHVPFVRGYAVTLTVRDCPPAAADWTRLRNAYFWRLRRAGLVRIHWVTEWQRRGIPHLHAAVWMPEDRAGDLLTAWLQVAAPYGAGPLGQHLSPITDLVGWLQYVAKHAARGVAHYQRAADGIPPAWRNRTGRIWGYGGDWPRVPPAELDLTDAAFWRLRRLIRSRELAAARRRPPSQRAGAILQARGMLRCPDRNLSAVRGLSKWCPEDLTMRLVAAAFS